MTSFDRREESFEAKFAHDQELTFKARARALRMLGLWAVPILPMFSVPRTVMSPFRIPTIEAEERLGTAEAALERSRATVERARAQADQAKTDLRCTPWQTT